MVETPLYIYNGPKCFLYFSVFRFFLDEGQYPRIRVSGLGAGQRVYLIYFPLTLPLKNVPTTHD